jgi:hypothetical protein
MAFRSRTLLPATELAAHSLPGTIAGNYPPTSCSCLARRVLPHSTAGTMVPSALNRSSALQFPCGLGDADRMIMDLGIAVVCTESRSRAARRRDNLSRREAGQDKRTRHGCRVKSMSAQGFFPHAFFRAWVMGNSRLLIRQGTRRHGYAGVRRSTATRVRPRG